MPAIEDASGYHGYADRVIAPADERELIDVLREAREAAIPVTVSGAGTGVTGGRVPHGGWSVSLERFRRLEVAEGRAVAGAGVLLRDLQAAAARTGQFYPPDPTEWSASVGGTLATNASGSRSFRYGDTRRNVLAIRVVLIDGSVLALERGMGVPFPFEPVRVRRTTKNTAGYLLRAGMDYLDLFVGSEGTLGVITEATLRLLPAPEELLSGVVFLPSEEAALDAVESWRSAEGLRMLEYMDRGSLDLLRERSPEIPAGAEAALLIEQEGGGEDAAGLWLERLEAAGALTGASWFGTGASDRERFRAFRHALPESVNDHVRRRGLLKMGTDFAVPVDRNREMMGYYRETLSARWRGKAVVFGHIGDAHVHVNLLPANGQEAGAAQELIREMAAKAVELGGTVSAEHGLGKRKAPLLRLMYTREEIASMLAVRKTLDPAFLLGRGNIFGDPPL